MTLRRAVPTIAAFLLASTVLTSPALAQSAAGQPWAPQSNPGVEAEWLRGKPRPDLNFRADARPSREQTLAAVEYVAASQIKDMTQRPLALSTGSNLTQMSSNWVAATFYIGAARLARVSDDPETLHFLTAEERLTTLRELLRRLKPGAPLVTAHHSFPMSSAQEKARWLGRYAAFAVASGVPQAHALSAVDAIGARLPLLAPEQEVALLQQAGFESIELFYAAFSFKGWVACAPK